MILPAPSPPQLEDISRCNKSLDFVPRAHWPVGLPAIAVNHFVLAGFQQELVLNHSIPWSESAQICQIFQSLHNDLSFTELARLAKKAETVPEFPLHEILQAYGLKMQESFQQVAQALLEQPIGFQNWCADKKVNAGDLLPLLSAKVLNLKPLLHKILQLQLSKSQGMQALEWGIELLLHGRPESDLGLHEDTHRDEWLKQLHRLRYPQAAQADAHAEETLAKLPWPGAGQVKWVRQGDKTGIELRLFVGQPGDLKKHLSSLAIVQDLLEKDSGELWTEH